MEKQRLENDNTKRSHWLHLRLKPEEHKLLSDAFDKTTFRKVSEYARAVLFNKKITVYERSKSLDEFIEELVMLRTELNHIGNNFNQVARRINGAKEYGELRAMALVSSTMQQKLLEKVDEIKERINEFADVWLQRL